MELKQGARVRLTLLVCIAALSQLSETIYTAALPDIARDLCVSESQVEATLTTFLLGFACGVLLWGRTSDFTGRKPALLAGLGLYILSCIGCHGAGTITALLAWRFLQAAGASVGSVLGQAIAREAFPPQRRAAVYSTVSMALALAPALGTAMGGAVDAAWGWRSVFALLWVLATGLGVFVMASLPETRVLQAKPAPLAGCAKMLLSDPHVLRMMLLIGGANGIMFAYYGEAPFVFIELHGLTPEAYGRCSLGLALPLFAGAWGSRRLLTRLSPPQVIAVGCLLSLCGAAQWAINAHLGILSAVATAAYAAWVVTGLAVLLPCCLSTALVQYGHMAGTASSLLGFGYYLVAAGSTYAMAAAHDGSVRRLPEFILAALLCMSMASVANMKSLAQHTT